jgi:branched-chain amino acid aminotransferase
MTRTWMNGAVLDGDMTLSPQDRGFTLGDGIFETLAVYNGVALWREQHLQRMKAAAIVLGLPFPAQAIAKSIKDLTENTKGQYVLRLTLTRGASGRGLAGDTKAPTLVGTLQDFDETLRFQPTSLMTSAVRRNLQSPATTLKTLSYIDNILAARNATALGFDDALMLNTAGRVACATIGNVFFEIDDALVTPSLKEGILPGIMREVVIGIAKQSGIVMRERQVRTSEIAKSNAMFVTNSLRLIRNVTRCDDKRFTRPSKILDSIIKGLLNEVQHQILLK